MESADKLVTFIKDFWLFQTASHTATKIWDTNIAMVDTKLLACWPFYLLLWYNIDSMNDHSPNSIAFEPTIIKDRPSVKYLAEYVVVIEANGNYTRVK